MRKRSKYRPKNVVSNPLQHVLLGNSNLETVAANLNQKTKLINRIALSSLFNGKGTAQDLANLMQAVLISRGLMAQGVGVGYEAVINTAIEALESLRKRFETLSRGVCTGPELTALTEAVELFEAQIENCSVAEIEKAIDAKGRPTIN